MAQRAPGLQQDIKSAVVKTAGNTFLLARLHVESLSSTARSKPVCPRPFRVSVLNDGKGGLNGLISFYLPAQKISIKKDYFQLRGFLIPIKRSIAEVKLG